MRQPGVDNFSIRRDLVCFFPQRAKRRRWVVPVILRPMGVTCFHDSLLAGHLGAHKTNLKIAAYFWRPKMWAEVFQYVRRCNLYQRAKPARETRVGWHTAQPSAQPLEKLFIDFLGLLTHTKRGNSAILVVLDSFLICQILPSYEDFHSSGSGLY